MSSFYKLLVAHQYYIKNCEYILKSNVTIEDTEINRDFIYGSDPEISRNIEKTIKIKMKNCQNLEKKDKNQNFFK